VANNGDTRELKVLLVDDEAGVRSILKDICQRLLGVRVLEAQDGREALGLFREQNPDIVVTDIRMPSMDGVTLLKRLKEQDPMVPIILITGYPSIDVAIRGMKEGASDFLTKPFQVEEVKVVLEKALRERKLLQENRELREEVHRKRALERLNEDLHRKLRELSALYTFGETVSTFPLSREPIIQSLVESAREVIHSKRLSFYIPNEDCTSFRVVAQSPDGRDRFGALARRSREEEVLLQVIRSKRPVRVQGLHVAGSFLHAEGEEEGPQLAVPLLIKGEVLGILHASGKITGGDFDRQDLLFLSELTKRASLGLENQYLYESLFEVLMSTLRSLVSTIEAKDPYTKEHSQQVTEFSILLARQMECPPDQVDTLRLAAQLHDLGKVGVRDSILLKPSRLTEEEFHQIRMHPVIGERILNPLGFLAEEKKLIRHHHERWDGKGYPDGLRGEEIPFLARILTVADAFDAMISDRPYRRGMGFEEAYREIVRCSGTQFDPRVVEAFREAFHKWLDRRSEGGSLSGDKTAAAPLTSEGITEVG